MLTAPCSPTPDTRIVMPLAGGLGNQLFQVSYAIACFGEALKQGRLTFDNSWFQTHAVSPHETIPPALRECLPCALGCIPLIPKNLWHRLHLISRGLLTESRGMLTDGIEYELSARLDPRKNLCRAENLITGGDVVRLPEVRKFLRRVKDHVTFNEAYKGLQAQLRAAPNFATLHVRRGDYLKVATFMPSIKFYRNALELLDRLAPGIEVWVHSDDIAWCRQQDIFLRRNCKFVDVGPQNDALQEMLTLSEASYVIMSNSTFSWWISAFALVCQPAYRMSIAPSRWYVGSNEPITHFLMRQDIICAKAW